MLPAELEIFLQLNLPWETQYQHLYKCVTTIVPDRGKGRPVVNNAVQSYPDLLKLIQSRSYWKRCDIYLAMGTLRVADTETSQDGFAKIMRRRNNVVSLKSLFCDIDAKDYGGSAAAVEAALQSFLQASGMPEPTMKVRSGSGGLHIYWCVDVPIDLAVWQPLAEALKRCAVKHGFKIDPAVTADAARVLRIPTTYNYKQQQPVEVELITTSSFTIYTMAGLTSALAPFIVVQNAKTGTGPTASASAWAQNFGVGDERTLPPIPIDQIAINCPMVAATLADGGAGKSEPEWSKDMYLAACTSDPADAAHRLSSGHKDYNATDTDKKLAEKQQAIAQGSLGWPSCASFGHAACQTCPLLTLGKSPVLFGHRMSAPAAQPMQPAYGTDPLMPEGYWRNSNNHVFTKGEYGPVDVLGYPILDGGIDPTTGELVLQTIISGKERWGAIDTRKHTPIAFCEALHKGTRHGILIKGDNKVVKAFVMSWMTHLQDTKRLIQPNGFGWAGANFVFGD